MATTGLSEFGRELMLKELNGRNNTITSGLFRVKLNYTDLSSSSEETIAWGVAVPESSGVPDWESITQSGTTTFLVDASSGSKTIKGFTLLWYNGSTTADGITYEFESTYLYESTGNFILDGITIKLY